MSGKANLQWVRAGDDRWYRVDKQNLPHPDDCGPTPAVRDDGEVGDIFVNLKNFAPLVQNENGEMLCRRTAGGGDRFALVKSPCGAEGDESCGCGCNHGYKIVVLSPGRAAVWLHAHGFSMDDAPASVAEAWSKMLIE